MFCGIRVQVKTLGSGAGVVFPNLSISGSKKRGRVRFVVLRTVAVEGLEGNVVSSRVVGTISVVVVVVEVFTSFVILSLTIFSLVELMVVRASLVVDAVEIRSVDIGMVVTGSLDIIVTDAGVVLFRRRIKIRLSSMTFSETCGGKVIVGVELGSVATEVFGADVGISVIGCIG